MVWEAAYIHYTATQGQLEKHLPAANPWLNAEQNIKTPWILKTFLKPHTVPLARMEDLLGLGS